MPVGQSLVRRASSVCRSISRCVGSSAETNAENSLSHQHRQEGRKKKKKKGGEEGNKEGRKKKGEKRTGQSIQTAFWDIPGTHYFLTHHRAAAMRNLKAEG